MYLFRILLWDRTCCHGYSCDSVKLHKIPNNVYTHKRFTRSLKIWRIVKHRKQIKSKKVPEFVLSSNHGTCKSKEKISMPGHCNGGSWIHGAPTNNALAWKLLELGNMHKHKHSRHKLELPSIKNAIGD